MIQITQAKGIAIYSFRHEPNKLCTTVENGIRLFPTLIIHIWDKSLTLIFYLYRKHITI